MSLEFADIVRLVDSSPFIVNGSSLVASVVYEAFQCKTFPTLPRKLDIIVSKVIELYLTEFQKVTYDFHCKDFATYEELFDWLHMHLLQIKEIRELNLSEAEAEAGIDVDGDARIRWTGEGTLPIEHDFIDLEAFIRNIAHDIIRSNVNINFSTFTKETAPPPLEPPEVSTDV